MTYLLRQLYIISIGYNGIFTQSKRGDISINGRH